LLSAGFAGDEPAPGEIALDTFTEERRGKWEKKPNQPSTKIKWGSEDFPDFTATRNMLPIPILRDAAFIRRVEIPSYARDMQNTRWSVLWAGDLYIPTFRQQPRIFRKHRIQNVLVRIFRNAIPRSEITATLKHLRLAPALQIDKTDSAAAISVRGKMVKRHIPLATPVNKLKSLTPHPLNRLRLVPQLLQFADIAMPKSVHIGIRNPIDIRQKLPKIQPQERHRRTFVSAKLAAHPLR